MKLTKQTTFNELSVDGKFRECIKYIHFEESATAENMKDISISDIENETLNVKDGSLMGLRNPNFDGDDALKGLKNLQQKLQQSEKVLYSVYSLQEIKSNPEYEDVKLFYLPGDKEKPFILICAGGAYQSVCSLTEAFPLAARANELGYTAFVLNYRVHYPVLFPRPMEDLAKAISYIMKEENFHGLNKRDYALVGFSAGGHLVAEWGTDNLGFVKWNMPAPAIIMLAYSAIQMELQAPESAEWFYRSVLEEESQENMDIYSVNKHITKQYPPVYITQCKDDMTVPFENSIVMEQALQKMKIPYRKRFGNTGGHGYALGKHTDAEGWFDEAVLFWEELRKENRDE